MSIEGLPVVNNNGTSREELIKLRKKAYTALGEAVDKLREMAPHGRDYQTVPYPQYEAAMKLWKGRVEILTVMRDNILKEAEALYEGGL